MHNEYRKRRGSDTWHFCGSCPRWPTSDYTTPHTRPPTGELCGECKAKDRTNRNKWAKDQVADLVESGEDPLDAERIVAAALAAIPLGEEPATYVQTPEAAARDAEITDEDIADARAEWYASEGDCR